MFAIAECKVYIELTKKNCFKRYSFHNGDRYVFSELQSENLNDGSLESP